MHCYCLIDVIGWKAAFLCQGHGNEHTRPVRSVFVKPIEGEEAEELKELCPMDVFDVEDASKLLATGVSAVYCVCVVIRWLCFLSGYTSGYSNTMRRISTRRGT